MSDAPETSLEKIKREFILLCEQMPVGPPGFYAALDGLVAAAREDQRLQDEFRRGPIHQWVCAKHAPPIRHEQLPCPLCDSEMKRDTLGLQLEKDVAAARLAGIQEGRRLERESRPLSGNNLLLRDNSRRCRTCEKRNSKQLAARRKESRALRKEAGK